MKNLFKEKFFRDSIGVFGAKIGNVCLSAAIITALAKTIGTEGLGVYVYVVSWISLLSIPASLGLNELLVREIVSYRVQGKHDFINGLLRFSSFSVMAASFFIASCAFLCTFLLESSINDGMVTSLRIGLISLPFVSMTSIRVGVLQGFDKILQSQLPEMLLAPILMFIVIALNYTFDISLLPIHFVEIYVLITVINFIFGIYLVRGSLVFKKCVNLHPKYCIKKWTRAIIPFVSLSSMRVLNNRVDVLILGILQGASAVGIYAVVNKISQIIVFVLMSFNKSLKSKIAKLYEEKQFDELQVLLKRSARTVSIISFSIFIFFIIFGGEILSLVGKEFHQGYFAIIILSCAYVFDSIIGPASQVLVASRNEVLLGKIVAITGLINLILNFITIPKWNISGAAISTSISLIIRNLAIASIVKFRLGLNPSIL